MYLRKSRLDMEAEARGEGDTLARHRRTLLDLARRMGISITQIYEEVVSGETIDARPEVQKLLRDVEAGRWKGVLCMEVERLARDTANWNRAQASARTSQWIKDYGDQIEVILSNNDDMALGAIDALGETPRDCWPLIVGVDATAPALEAVAAGQMYGTVHNDSLGQAQAMFQLALALWNGEDPAQAVALEEEHYVWLPYQKVDLRNLDRFS